MRRSLAVLCALALTGCGQAASSTEEFEGEEREVAEVVEALQSAGERREGDRICKEILSADLVEELEQGDVNCTQELEKALREADDTSLEVTAVEVTGETATATVEGREGTETITSTLGLVREREAWRVASLAD